MMVGKLNTSESARPCGMTTPEPNGLPQDTGRQTNGLFVFRTHLLLVQTAVRVGFPGELA